MVNNVLALLPPFWGTQAGILVILITMCFNCYYVYVLVHISDFHALMQKSQVSHLKVKKELKKTIIFQYTCLEQMKINKKKKNWKGLFSKLKSAKMTRKNILLVCKLSSGNILCLFKHWYDYVILIMNLWTGNRNG